MFQTFFYTQAVNSAVIHFNLILSLRFFLHHRQLTVTRDFTIDKRFEILNSGCLVLFYVVTFLIALSSSFIPCGLLEYFISATPIRLRNDQIYLHLMCLCLNVDKNCAAHIFEDGNFRQRSVAYISEKFLELLVG